VRPVVAATRKTQQRKQQSSCAAASCHGPWPQAIKKHHPVRQPVTAASEKNNQTVRPLTAASNKKAINLCDLSRLQEEKQSTCESGGEPSRVKQQSTCARSHKHMQNTHTHTHTTTINRCGLSWPQQEEKKQTTIILCDSILSWPTAASKKNRATSKENKRTFNLWQNGKKRTINLCGLSWLQTRKNNQQRPAGKNKRKNNLCSLSRPQAQKNKRTTTCAPYRGRRMRKRMTEEDKEEEDEDEERTRTRKTTTTTRRTRTREGKAW